MEEVVTFRDGGKVFEPVVVTDTPLPHKTLSIREFDSENLLVIDSYFDLIDVVPKSLATADGSIRIEGRYSRPDTPEGMSDIYARYQEALERDMSKKLTVFTVCPTYSCNMSCVYCFEKNYEVDRKTISWTDLDAVLRHIEGEILHIRERTPDAPIRIEFFGGEPLQAKNKSIVERVLQFSRDNACSVSIVSNGYELREFVGLLLRYRDIVAEISVTLDGPQEVHNETRRVAGGEGSFDAIADNVDLFLDLGFYMNVCTNVNTWTIGTLATLFAYYEDRGWPGKHNFRSTIGRVYDRLSTIGCSTVTEVDVLKVLLELYPGGGPEWLRSGFLKTSDRLAKLINMDFGQDEWGRALYHYCWSTSPILDGYYLDPAMNTFRCTTTVGNEAYSIGKLPGVNAESYKERWLGNNAFKNDECRLCRIAGLCAGGCALEYAAKGKDYVCDYENAVFDQFVDEILTPHLKRELAGA